MEDDQEPKSARRDWEGIPYDYRITAVEHFPELQEEIDRLRRAGLLSEHPLYREYIEALGFALLEGFPSARSAIILANLTPPARVHFHFQGRARTVTVPPQYFRDAVTPEWLDGLVTQDILGGSGHRFERAWHLHLKLLAVRSGLARYGCNNIIYVPGMGSYLTLRAFFTDAELPDHWQEMALLEECRECRVCRLFCPDGCIGEKVGVIDAGRCLTLYN